MVIKMDLKKKCMIELNGNFLTEYSVLGGFKRRLGSLF